MALKKDKIMLGNGFPVLPDFEAMETGEATKQDIYDTQGMIAYVQKTLKADQAYTAGDSFIYNGKLYTATANIAKDANIVLEGAGENAELSVDLVTQIKAYPAYNLDYLTTGLEYTGCTYVSGGYNKIGNIVFVDIRVTKTSETTGFSITGFPGYSDRTANGKTIVPVSGYNMTTEANEIAYAAINQLGVLAVTATVDASEEFALHAVYLSN